ncbi:hypothetical protein ABL78_2385 [Leptomonas seymouri]|uniref:MIF4G domain-containing protein n=1 Tax=Leptomonas seymouri TaxID=5684 RepID=A0A0N0P782_LEPSE|nr:hypothetical protein ABL78_2385 [Leptomonas seymouri]|eukprot:KPI88489.1 hypothetical protein ABL78_2385 [Leptomonas seymouri]
MVRRYPSTCSLPRSRSAPKSGKSPRTPSTFYAFPSTLQEIFYGPRQRLTKYADGMRALPVPSSPLSIAREGEESGEASRAVEVAAVPNEHGVANSVGLSPNDESSPADAAQAATHASEPKAVTTGAREDDRDAAEEEVAIPGEEDAATPAAVVAEDSKHLPGSEERQSEASGEDAEGETGAANVIEGSRAESTGSAVEREPLQSSSCDAEKEEREMDDTKAAGQPRDLPQLRATAECIAFDPALVETWMSDFRHDTAHVPAGVDAFVRRFDQIAAKFNLKVASGSAASSPLMVGSQGKRGRKGSSSFTASIGSPKSGVNGSPMDLSGRDSSFGGAVAPHLASGSAGAGMNSGIAVKKSNALEALGDVWEGRHETPISLTQGSIRRRGLFGEVEKKKIHHMVVAVLNKVTTDPAKFREVKNELLRLPIPEANAEQLTKIVDAFFTKAVREQHFSHSYADLIVALCKVPQGQHIVGDKTQSLEYRLRVALLKRCQSEFVQSVKQESSSMSTSLRGADDAALPLTAAIQTAEESGGETEKERRDRMCGNVRFVCELFLRDVVVGTVISFIFRVCLLGSEFAEFRTPPDYMPTESQVDEVITAIKTVKERYFVQNVEGRRMLPLVLVQLAYWVQHYPISRCRFLLISIVEDLQAMLPAPEPNVAPPLAVASSVHSDGTAPSTSAQPEMGLVTTATASAAHRLLAPREVLELTSGSPLAPAIPIADGSQSPMSSTMVGGQPLPAPRSKQTGNASVTESMGSFAGTAPVESTVGSPLLALSLTLSSRTLLQAVRPEAIAKFMAALSSGQCTPKEIALQFFDQYGNVLPVLAAWMDRCLSVAKEEKPRKQTGALLVACAQHLTSHLSPNSMEWIETMSACREQVHEVAMEALQRAVEGKLYEDLRIFQFWAQLILSDHDRVVYDEEMLNESLELIAYTAPVALRNFLVEVGKYVNQVLLKPESVPWHTATEAHNFVRYRPLLVLHSLVLSGGAQEAQELLDSVLSFADVRQQSLEMRLYHAFRNGTPSREVIFEQLRSSPRLTSRDPTLAAEVLSAMLIAELCSDGVALVENNMDLIQITVDGVNRAAREMALVAEVYDVLRYSPKSLPRTAAARVLRKFVFMHILSDETMDRADRFYVAEREGVIEKPEKDSRVLEPPPSTQAVPTPAGAAGAVTDFPRIADRLMIEGMRSASTSLRSVGSNNNATISASNVGGSVNANGIAEGAAVDFRVNTAGTNPVEGNQSSNGSSLAEFRPHNSARQSQSMAHNSSNNSQHRRRDSGELSSRHSLRQTSPTRSHDDASKRLYRNSYKKHRRSREGGSEILSSAGESKDASPQQPPVAHTPPSTYDGTGLESNRVGSGSASRYSRGGNNGSSGAASGGSRGGRGGQSERGGGGGPRGGRGGRGSGRSSSAQRGGRGGRGGHDDVRRGGGRYNSRGGGSNRE